MRNKTKLWLTAGVLAVIAIIIVFVPKELHPVLWWGALGIVVLGLIRVVFYSPGLGRVLALFFLAGIGLPFIDFEVTRLLFSLVLVAGALFCCTCLFPPRVGGRKV